MNGWHVNGWHVSARPAKTGRRPVAREPKTAESTAGAQRTLDFLAAEGICSSRYRHPVPPSIRLPRQRPYALVAKSGRRAWISRLRRIRSMGCGVAPARKNANCCEAGSLLLWRDPLLPCEQHTGKPQLLACPVGKRTGGTGEDPARHAVYPKNGHGLAPVRKLWPPVRGHQHEHACLPPAG